jgi:protein ImuB
VQTEWRVACVRIPRFPIGAAFNAKLATPNGKGDEQLLLITPDEKAGACSSTAEEQFSAPASPAVKQTAFAGSTGARSAPPSTKPRPQGAAENYMAENHWDESFLALTDGSPNRPRLRSVSAAAARVGVRAGMTLAEGRALCAKLEALVWDDVVVTAAITETTARFVQASPQVTPVAGAPGMWWIGASGFAPGIGTERLLATTLLGIARQWHPRARVAIADTCIAARAATWAGASFGGGRNDHALVTVIPPGGDAAYLESAPMTLVPMDVEMRDALHALGIRTIGQFAELGAGDVEQRWGEDGLTAWRLAHGDDPRRPILARFDDSPHVDVDLATPAATMEPVLFLIRPGLENLVTQLVAQGRAIASLAITLTLDDARGPLPSALAHTVTREIRLPRPLARPAPLFERCRGLLARWPLTAPVTAVRLTVLLTGPLTGEQGNLLDTSWRDPSAADAALERVRAELGPNVVVTPRARDGYTPERSGIWREEAGGWREEEKSASPSSLRSPPSSQVVSLRLLEVPEKVEVERDPEPCQILWRGHAIAIANAVGPERLSGDWWNDGFSRDYWRCESDTEDGELLLYRDSTGWWIQGWYD